MINGVAPTKQACFSERKCDRFFAFNQILVLLSKMIGFNYSGQTFAT
jgi:hypothetical protein